MRRGFPGAKPERFCFWVFEGLNLTPEDEFHDLFPGSGAVGEAWEKWKNRAAPEQLELVGPNGEVRGASRLAGEASTSTVVLGAVSPGKETK